MYELVPDAPCFDSDDPADEDSSDEDWGGDPDTTAHPAPEPLVTPSNLPAHPPKFTLITDPVMPPVSKCLGPTSETSFKLLDLLLDVERLQEEGLALDAGHNLVGKPMDASSLVQLLRDRLDLDNQVTALMELSPQSKYNDITHNDEAVSILDQVVGSVDILPTLLVESEKLHILQRAIQWQMCRSYLLFFQWYEESGPSLARKIVRSHQVSTIDTTFQSFSKCVDHIVQYVKWIRT